jgi:hypothetical protein
MMADLGELIEESGEPVRVEVPRWAVIGIG